MTKEQFLSLTERERAAIVFDALEARLSIVSTGHTPAPSGGRGPKYDGKLSRKGGFVWMSEMLLADLEWWLAKKREGAEDGGRYADRDRKTAGELERWIAFRTSAPAAPWVGVRGEERVTAAVPARDPELHPWPSRGPARLDVRDDDRPAPGAFDDRDYGGGADDSIPF